MPNRNLTTTQYLDILIKGNERWKNGESTNWFGDTHYEELLQAQAPFAVVIACADSRVVPEFIFDTVLGELFVIRIAGNIITAEVLASIEYAVSALGTKLVLVLGHQNCGAVTAKVELVRSGQNSPSPNLTKMLDQINLNNNQDSNTISLADNIKYNTGRQAKKILQQSQLLENANKDEQFAVISAYYRLDQKDVLFLN